MGGVVRGVLGMCAGVSLAPRLGFDSLTRYSCCLDYSFLGVVCRARENMVFVPRTPVQLCDAFHIVDTCRAIRYQYTAHATRSARAALRHRPAPRPSRAPRALTHARARAPTQARERGADGECVRSAGHAPLLSTLLPPSAVTRPRTTTLMLFLTALLPLAPSSSAHRHRVVS